MLLRKVTNPAQQMEKSGLVIARYQACQLQGEMTE